MNTYPNLYYSCDRIKALLLLLLVAVVYLPFLNNPLVFDDVTFFKNALNFAGANFDFTFRWFPYTTIGVTSAFFDEAPPFFRLQNLLLHGLNLLMLLLVLRLWISLFVAEPVRQKMANWGAWLGVLVFACHPLVVYGTGYLVQRSILMATLFTLLLHLAYFRGLIAGDKRYAALAVAAYFLAVFSKEHSLMVPAILLPMTWMLRAQIKLPPRTLLATWIGFAVVALIVVMRTKGIFGQTYEMDAPALFGQEEMLKGLPMLHLLSALTQAGLFFKYCLLMLVPNPAWMSIDMRESFIFSLSDWKGWGGGVAFLVYGVAALWCLLRGGRIALLGLALLYPWLLFLTEFSTIRVQEIFVLYRTYLWLPGYMLLLPLIVSALPTCSFPLLGGRLGWGFTRRNSKVSTPSLALPDETTSHSTKPASGQVAGYLQGGGDIEARFFFAGAFIALLLVPLAWDRLWVFADNYRLWDDAVTLLHGENRLGAQRIYYSRGYYAAKDHGNWTQAIEDYKKSLQISSAFPPVRIALAGAYANAGRNQEALAEYDRAIAADTKDAEAFYGKALFLKKMRDDAGALASMQKSCDLGKNMACAMVNLSKMKKN